EWPKAYVGSIPATSAQERRHMFYCFYQVPLYGEPVYDQDKGISRFVVIEGESAFHANALANDKGLDWEPLTGQGEMWYSVSKKDGHNEPAAMGFEIDLLSEFDPELTIEKVIDGYEGFVHYLDKQIVGFWN